MNPSPTPDCVPSMTHAFQMTRVPEPVLRRLAVAADCDPRTIQRAIDGGRIRTHVVAMRVAAVLKKAGYELPPRSDKHPHRTKQEKGKGSEA